MLHQKSQSARCEEATGAAQKTDISAAGIVVLAKPKGLERDGGGAVPLPCTDDDSQGGVCFYWDGVGEEL